MASTAVLPPVVGPNTSGLGADIDLSNDDDEEMLEDKDEKPLLAPSKNIRVTRIPHQFFLYLSNVF